MRNTITIEDAVKTIARFWSVLSTIMILLFLFGEGLDPSRLTVNEWVGFLFFPLGLVLGLIISWKKEIFGGVVTIVSVTVFTIMMGINWFIFALGFPAVLFIIHAMIVKNKSEV
ncbi:MAG: hypothetical protein WB779_06175 [Ignavibacteriaceae bacterium]|jgi:amino acid permease